MNYTIYKHTTPSNKVYVGITKQNPNKTAGGYHWEFCTLGGD